MSLITSWDSARGVFVDSLNSPGSSFQWGLESLGSYLQEASESARAVSVGELCQIRLEDTTRQVTVSQLEWCGTKIHSMGNYRLTL
jgi:hypothetical protein